MVPVLANLNILGILTEVAGLNVLQALIVQQTKLAFATNALTHVQTPVAKTHIAMLSITFQCVLAKMVTAETPSSVVIEYQVFLSL